MLSNANRPPFGPVFELKQKKKTPGTDCGPDPHPGSSPESSFFSSPWAFTMNSDDDSHYWLVEQPIPKEPCKSYGRWEQL